MITKFDNFLNEEGPALPIFVAGMMANNMARGKPGLPLFQYDDDDDDDDTSYSGRSKFWFDKDDIKELKSAGFTVEDKVCVEHATKTIGDYTITIDFDEQDLKPDVLLTIKNNKKRFFSTAFKKRYYTVWSAIQALKEQFKKLGIEEPKRPLRPTIRPANVKRPIRRGDDIDTSKYGEEDWEDWR